MKIGIILFIIGSFLTLYFSKVKLEKNILQKLAIIIGILLLIYGVILMIQPNEYIVYTQTTISK